MLIMPEILNYTREKEEAIHCVLASLLALSAGQRSILHLARQLVFRILLCRCKHVLWYRRMPAFALRADPRHL